MLYVMLCSLRDGTVIMWDELEVICNSFLLFCFGILVLAPTLISEIGFHYKNKRVKEVTMSDLDLRM
jgi:hypothetical protein